MDRKIGQTKDVKVELGDSESNPMSRIVSEHRQGYGYTKLGPSSEKRKQNKIEISSQKEKPKVTC